MLSVSSTVKQKVHLPRTFFVKAKNMVLGKDYELSVVFVGKKKIKDLNTKYRGKNKPTDILSFSLEKNVGELFICLDLTENLKTIFIHGLCHLKGLDHGSRMEKLESKICRALSQ